MMIEKAVVDRFEGKVAVILVGAESRPVNIPRKALPKGTKAGVWLNVEFEGDVLQRVEVDLEETRQARQRILEKLERLRQGKHRE